MIVFIVFLTMYFNIFKKLNCEVLKTIIIATLTMSSYATTLLNKIETKKQELKFLKKMLEANNELVENKIEEILKKNNVSKEEIYSRSSTRTKKEENKSDSGFNSDSIKELYKKLCVVVHPDKNKDANSNEIFAELNQSFKTGDICYLLKTAIENNISVDSEQFIFDIYKHYQDTKNMVKNIKNSDNYKILMGDTSVLETCINLHKENSVIQKENEELKQEIKKAKEKNLDQVIEKEIFLFDNIFLDNVKNNVENNVENDINNLEKEKADRLRKLELFCNKTMEEKIMNSEYFYNNNAQEYSKRISKYIEDTITKLKEKLKSVYTGNTFLSENIHKLNKILWTHQIKYLEDEYLLITNLK